MKIYRIFNSVLSSYVQRYNLKYNRKGALMASPLQNKLLTNENYRVNLCRYIHYNPVKAKIVSSAINWEFSNYPEWIGKRKGTLFCDEILSDFGIKNYEESLTDYGEMIAEDSFFEMLHDEDI
jgi:putative transposase